MSNKIVPLGGRYFSKVARVRDKIREDSEELYQEFRQALKMAAMAGEYEAVVKGYMYLFGHMPADEEGVRVVDPDIDKPQQIDKTTAGPVIQIGFQLGGVNAPTALPAPTPINVQSDEPDEQA